MSEAFVHIGAHKTASTMIQMNLIRSREQLLDDCALGLVTRSDLLQTPFADEIYRVSQGEHDASSISDEAAASLRPLLPAEEQDVLITNEDLICHLPIEDFYQNAEAAIRYLVRILGDYDVHVILYIRRQTDYLESIFMQFVHLGRRLKFGQFMERAEGVDLSWLKVAEAIERALPAGRLRLRPFEQIRNLGETAYYRDFLALCGVGEVEKFEIDEEYAKGRAANRSYGKLGLQIAQRVNPILSPKERKLFRRFLQEHFSTATHPRADLLGEERRQAIMNEYEDSNRKLFERYDLGVDGRSLDYY